MSKKEEEIIEEPTLEDLEEEEIEDSSVQNSDDETEKETEVIETESLEARVENEKKTVEDGDETEGSFISVEATEKRNIKTSDLKDEEVVAEIQEDEFTCTVCFLVLRNTQLAKPRAKVCVDCV